MSQLVFGEEGSSAVRCPDYPHSLEVNIMVVLAMAAWVSHTFTKKDNKEYQCNSDTIGASINSGRRE